MPGYSAISWCPANSRPLSQVMVSVFRQYGFSIETTAFLVTSAVRRLIFFTKVKRDFRSTRVTKAYGLFFPITVSASQSPSRFLSSTTSGRCSILTRSTKFPLRSWLPYRLRRFFWHRKWFVKVTSTPFVCVDILVNPLMTDTNFPIFLHPERDLFRAPILTDLFFYPPPGLGWDSSAIPAASLHRFAMSLFGTISSLASVPPHLSADSRFVNSDRLGYLRLIVVTFQKCLYLISLTLGKLCVVHKRSFDLLGLKRLILHRLTSFNLQSCTYELNLAFSNKHIRRY